MTQEDYKIISTSCPILNIDFRNSICDGSPNLDVLLKLKDNEPTEIICPEFQNKGICKLKIQKDSHINESLVKCIYALGWRPLKK